MLDISVLERYIQTSSSENFEKSIVHPYWQQN